MNRAIAAGLAATALALAAGPLAQAAKPPKPPQQGKGLTINVAPNPVVFGRATVVSGRLTGKNHAGQTVSLQSDPYPFGTFAPVATAVTNASGDVSFQQRPQANARYLLRQGGTTSAVLTVLVRFRTGIHVSDSTPAAGSRVRFSGRACPAHVGGRVAVQRRTHTGAWHTVRRTTLKSAARCSVYATRLRVRRDATYRTVVARDAAHARGISRRRRVDVH